MRRASVSRSLVLCPVRSIPYLVPGMFPNRVPGTWLVPCYWTWYFRVLRLLAVLTVILASCSYRDRMSIIRVARFQAQFILL